MALNGLNALTDFLVDRDETTTTQFEAYYASILDSVVAHGKNQSGAVPFFFFEFFLLGCFGFSQTHTDNTQTAPKLASFFFCFPTKKVSSVFFFRWCPGF